MSRVAWLEIMRLNGEVMAKEIKDVAQYMGQDVECRFCGKVKRCPVFEFKIMLGTCMKCLLRKHRGEFDSILKR